MSKNNILYIQMIDEIRKQKHISVEALIENITSNRSYRRYLKETLSPPLNVIEQLIERLGVDFADILVYTLTVKKQSSGFIEFITYVHFDELHLAKPYFEKIRHYNIENQQLRLLIDGYLRLYEFKTSIIDESSLIKHLTKLVTFYESHPFDTNEALALIILYHAYVPDQTQFPLNKINDILLHKNLHFVQILLYDIMFDQYLHTLLKKTDVDLDMYIQLASHAIYVTQLWVDAIFIYAGHFHQAMVYHFKGQVQERNLYFMKYLSYRHTVLSKNNIPDDTFIEEILNIDIITFKKKMYHQLLINKKT